MYAEVIKLENYGSTDSLSRKKCYNKFFNMLLTNNLIRLFCLVLIGCSSLFSCTTRNLIYFSDLPKGDFNTQPVENFNDTRIQPLDVLSITVSTLNPESNLLFNSGVFANLGSDATGSVGTPLNDGYRVDKSGEIGFPVLGKVALGGLTLDEATAKMVDLLESEVRNPIVNVKMLNFKITVVGEVNRPSAFPVLTEKINIIEAIGLAGDLTAFGKRENVLLIREIDGKRSTIRMNLNNKDVFLSPYYYLQQNDIVYVEPVRAKASQASMGRQNLSIALSVVSILSIFITQLF